MSSDDLERKKIKHEQRRLEDKLDKMLGFYYWRTYWSTSMWANLATPLNLGITIFTALMTVHSSSSSSFISDDLNIKINIATFFISIINTFFAPQKQFSDLNEYLSKWGDLGNHFEKVIFSDQASKEKIDVYLQILDDANKLFKDQFSKHRNFVTDLLHVLIRVIFMNSNDRWMNNGPFEFYERIQSDGIELDFDFEKFKASHKTTNMFSRLCSCFSCCFPNSSDQTKVTQKPVVVTLNTPEVSQTIEMTPIIEIKNPIQEDQVSIEVQ